MDALFNQLPELNIPVNQENFQKWVAEVVPWFEEVHITDKASFPTTLTFESYKDAFHAHHIVGTSTCGNVITMNDRVEDSSFSSWRNTLNFWGGVVHEVAHTQQGDLCYMTPKNSFVETSAQVAMVTVLSAMTTDGNRIAAYSLVNELCDFGIGAAYYLAIRNDQPERFWTMMRYVNTTSLEQARLERARNSWEGKERKLSEILWEYEYDPLDILLSGHKNGDKVANLLLPNPNFSIADFGYLMERQHLEKILREEI